ncbi:MAG: hypothetical protein IKS45_02145, partial [Thermoguttaceae bacterium]|nr:hypothetical protein [Thermoguttaceae bacterium]
CGTTQDEGRKFKDIYMVNHSFWYKPAIGKLEVFIPEKGSNLFPDRYWIQDGIFLDGTLHLFAMRCGKNWKPERIDLISLPIRDDGKPDFVHAVIKKDVPLQAHNENGQIVFGGAVLDKPIDGYYYIYGYQDNARERSRKDMVAARVPVEKLCNISAWRFWDGQDWGEDIKRCAPLARGISCEFSVSPIPPDRVGSQVEVGNTETSSIEGKTSSFCPCDYAPGPEKGRFILVNTRHGISPLVEYRIGDSPIGPFTEPTTIYRAPEHKDGVSVYNGKGHPDLSTDEYLIISYNVNRLGRLPRNPMEYRPRFIRLRYEDLGNRQ